MGDLVLQAELGERRRAVAAADHGDAGAGRDGLGDRARAAGERRAARTRPSGRSRRRCPPRLISAAYAAAVRGPTSRPIQPSGTSTPSSACGGRRRPRSAPRARGRRQAQLGARRRVVEHTARRLEILVRGTATRRPRGPAPSGTGSTSRRRSAPRRHARRKASSTPILSVTFAPPTIATSGRGGSARIAADRLDLALEQQAGGARAQVPDDADVRGVRAVRDAERVVDVCLREPRVGLREHADRSSSPPARSGRSRASARRPGFSPRASPSTGLADDRGRERHVPAGQLGEPVGGGAQRERRVDAASGARGARRGRASSRRRAAAVSVGSAARMRVSSVIWRASSSGTLKSTRTKTRFPARSTSSRVRMRR